MPLFTYGYLYSLAKFLFAWDAYFYIGTPILIVKIGKISLFPWGDFSHRRMLIFTVKTGTRMPIFT